MMVRQTPASVAAVSQTNVAALEGVLEEWFRAPVVLTSSGRAAISLMLALFGLNRYRHRVALPRLISTCVLDAVIRHAFPVDVPAPNDPDATILYHQYGFPQIARPRGRVLEDICHAFFAGAETGHRNWAGEARVFSLPKFLSTSACVGGIVVNDSAAARAIRARRDAFPSRDTTTVEREAGIFQAQDKPDGALDQMYLSRLLNPRISDSELGNLPRSVEDIRDTGRRRSEIAASYLDAVSRDALPTGWPEMIRQNLPYFFPVGGDPAALAKAVAKLTEAHIEAGLYSIDVARNMAAPILKRMLLIPAHHAVPDMARREIVAALRSL